MTLENDRNDVIARDMGFDVIDHPRGRQHDHSRYQKSAMHVWRSLSSAHSIRWVVALFDGRRYRWHRTHDDLRAALMDAADAAGAYDQITEKGLEI